MIFLSNCQAPWANQQEQFGTFPPIWKKTCSFSGSPIFFHCLSLFLCYAFLYHPMGRTQKQLGGGVTLGTLLHRHRRSSGHSLYLLNTSVFLDQKVNLMQMILLNIKPQWIFLPKINWTSYVVATVWSSHTLQASSTQSFLQGKREGNRVEREVTSSCPNCCNKSIQIVQFSSHMPLALFNTRLKTLQIWKVWQVSKYNRKIPANKKAFRISIDYQTITLHHTHTHSKKNMTSTVLQWWLGDDAYVDVIHIHTHIHMTYCKHLMNV